MSGRPRLAGGAMLIALVMFAGAAAAAVTPAGPGQLPLVFARNMGQTGPEIRFHAIGTARTVAFFDQGVLIRLPAPGGSGFPSKPRGAELTARKSDRETATREALRVRLIPVGMPPGVKPEGEDPRAARVRYLRGDRETEVPVWGSIRYAGAWPGIDLRFYGAGRDLEYDFLVAPGADPSRAAIRVEGVTELSLAPDGSLLLALPGGGAMVQKPPLAWQEDAGRRIPVKARYRLGAGADEQTFTIALGDWDRARSLVIDPVVILSSYFGTDTSDGAEAVALDPAGNIYLAGNTDSVAGLATGWSIAQAANGGGWDAFVAKFSPKMAGLIWATYLGGGAEDLAWSLAVDAGGSAVIAGQTRSNDFPLKNQVFGRKNPVGPTAFVARFDPSGALAYSTCLGGNGESVAWDVALDELSNAYVTGRTSSANLAVTGNALSGFLQGEDDAFVLKLPPSGKPFLYLTYLGGSDYDAGTGIAVRGGDIYVCGGTLSLDFPATAGAFQTGNPSSGCGTQGFVARINQAGSFLTWATYLGGADSLGYTHVYDLAVDGKGAAYLTGETTAVDFPVTAGAFDTTFNNPHGPGTPGCEQTDTFVAKLGSGGAKLVWATFLGSTDYDTASDIGLDSSGRIWVVGTTSGADFPQQGAAQSFNGGCGSGLQDSFVTQVAADGASLPFSTFLGGCEKELATGLGFSKYGEVYAAGATASDDFPLVAPYQAASAGQWESFVTAYSQKESNTWDAEIFVNWDVVPYLCPGEEIRVTIPGIIYGDRRLDLSRLKAASLSLGGQMTVRRRAEGSYQTALQDMNGDGVADLRFRLAPRGFRLQAGENTLVLWARLRNGDYVRGESVVRVDPNSYLCADRP